MERIQLQPLHKRKGKVADERRCHFLIIILLLFKHVHTQGNITFERNPKDYDVFRGDPALLLCDFEADVPVSISHRGDVIVENSVLRVSSSKYTFRQPILNNAYSLKIHKVERSDSGIYFCRAGTLNIKQLNLKVYYWPSREPVCASSHNFSTFFFEDMLNEGFQFNCTVEDGNPRSKVLILMELGTKERIELNDVVVNESEGKNPKQILTFSSKLNSSFHNSSFICNVRQEMPPSLRAYDYEQYCVYGPMVFIRKFETLVSPRSVSINQGESVSLICSSNVYTAEKEWITNFSDGVKWEINKMENHIKLTLSVLKGYDYSVIIVVCESSFGHRNSSAVGQINITREKPKHFIFIVVVVCIFILIVMPVVIAVVCKFLLKSLNQASTGRTVVDGECMEHMVATS